MSQLAVSHANRARILHRTLGLKRAAGFLRNRGVSVEEAVTILLKGGAA